MTQQIATHPVAWTNTDGVAVDGYDIVAYQADGEARKGSSDHEASLFGVSYRFASRQHLDAFLDDPARYLPAYGGYCAFAMGAKVAKVEPDPETFRIVEGRLLLFFNGHYEGQNLDTSVMFDEEPAKLSQQAARNWPDVAPG